MDCEAETREAEKTVDQQIGYHRIRYCFNCGCVSHTAKHVGSGSLRSQVTLTMLIVKNCLTEYTIHLPDNCFRAIEEGTGRHFNHASSDDYGRIAL